MRKSMMVSSSVRVAVCLGVFLFSILVYIATVRSVVPWPTNLYLHDVREIKEPIPINLSLPNYQKAHAKLYQYHKLFSNKTSLEPFSDPQQPATVTTWWQAAALIDWYLEDKPRYNCKKLKRFGNWAACMDPPFTIAPPCLVYSFGIAFDFSFDDAMFKHGCEVHSFDPSMLQPSYQRNESSWFHNLGLSSRNTDSYRPPPDQYVKAPQVWQMRTLTSVKEMLGHTGRVIDLLKIDIEGFEWDVVENMRETGELELLRQFSLEFHLFPKFPPMEDYVHLYKTFTNLREEMGFAEFSARPHPKTLEKDKFNLQGDSQFVNTLFRYPPAP